MTTKSINVQFNTTMDAQLETIMLTRSTRDAEEIFQQIFERGLYALSYRTLRNKRVYSKNKELREEIKALKAELKK